MGYTITLLSLLISFFWDIKMKGLHWLLVLLIYGVTHSIAVSQPLPQPFAPEISNQDFREEIVSFVEHQAQNKQPIQNQELNNLDKKYNNHYQKSDWTVAITCYDKGKIAGQGAFNSPSLVAALYQATEQTLHDKAITPSCRFKIDFLYYPDHHFAFISNGHRGLELTGNRIAIRKMTSENLKNQIKNSTSYLLGVMNPTFHGFYKFYDAGLDVPEKFLRTIYSSSSLYTLININQINPQPQLESLFKPIADFILARQLTTGPNKGAFYYGMDPATRKNSSDIVVGTASKTIFTLLKLNDLYPNSPQYLHSAKMAGNWLASQVLPDGKVIAKQSLKQGAWKKNTKQSVLYSGQVLSALSRLYAVTNDQLYKDKAKLIADNFVHQVQTNGPLIGDDYRPANSISSSWVMMSLLDYAKIDSTPLYSDIIQQVARKISERQLTNPNDIYYLGRYLDAMTTSGNGWINEVFGEYYPWCKKMQFKDCEQYKKAMILTSRWLLQNAYTQENTYNVKNPAQAIGGFIMNYNSQRVRTDAVCHGVNSLISLLNMMDIHQNVLLDIPEQSIEQLFPLLRAGNIKT